MIKKILEELIIFTGYSLHMLFTWQTISRPLLLVFCLFSLHSNRGNALYVCLHSQCSLGQFPEFPFSYNNFEA